MTKDVERIADRIRGARQRDGISQQELACRVGTTRQTISRIEKGRIEEVSLGMIEKVANVLGLEVLVQPRVVFVPIAPPSEQKELSDQWYEEYYGSYKGWDIKYV